MRPLILAAALLVLSAASASGLAGIDGITFEPGASYSWAFSDQVAEIDRRIWKAGGSIFISVGDHLDIGAGYTAGGIIYQSSGHTLLHGPSIDLRLRPFGRVYIGARISRLKIDRFRSSPQKSVSLYTGIPLSLGGRVTMLNEIRAERTLTDYPVTSFGVRNALEVRLK